MEKPRKPTTKIRVDPKVLEYRQFLRARDSIMARMTSEQRQRFLRGLSSREGLMTPAEMKELAKKT
jgi:hypothetical protein